jgi:hypothetical protein
MSLPPSTLPYLRTGWQHDRVRYPAPRLSRLGLLHQSLRPAGAVIETHAPARTPDA